MKLSPPLQKNDIVELTIDALGAEGEGIGRVDGFAVFVAGSLIHERVEVKIIKVSKNFAIGKLLRNLEASKSRVEPVCPVFGKCGGCQLQHMSYDEQLIFKQNKVEQALKRIGGIEIPVEPTIGMDDPYYYRNKGQFPVGRGIYEEPDMGFYATHSHRIVPIERCYIQNRAHEEILNTVKRFMLDYNITAYDEETHRGLVRHIVMRESHSTGEMNITVVINGKSLPHAHQFVEALRRNPLVTSICINQNEERTNVILGDVTKTLYGELYIIDTIGDISFRISPQSFYQVNPVQTEKLYSKALEFAGLAGDEVVWDAYCGIGTISLFLAQRAKMVYGVEIVPEAIEDARFNQKANGITNAQFFVGPAEKVIEEQYQKGIVADVIVVDPPRKGCEESLLQTMIRMAPKRIVYVSCDPGTLARDVKVLTTGGYRVERVQPVDMFPHGVHVETVCLLEKKVQ